MNGDRTFFWECDIHNWPKRSQNLLRQFTFLLIELGGRRYGLDKYYHFFVYATIIFLISFFLTPAGPVHNLIVWTPPPEAINRRLLTLIEKHLDVCSDWTDIVNWVKILHKGDNSTSQHVRMKATFKYKSQNNDSAF